MDACPFTKRAQGSEDLTTHNRYHQDQFLHHPRPPWPTLHSTNSSAITLAAYCLQGTAHTFSSPLHPLAPRHHPHPPHFDPYLDYACDPQTVSSFAVSQVSFIAIASAISPTPHHLHHPGSAVGAGDDAFACCCWTSETPISIPPHRTLPRPQSRVSLPPPPSQTVGCWVPCDQNLTCPLLSAAA